MYYGYTGTIPTEVGGLSEVTSFSLTEWNMMGGDYGFSGDIPSELGLIQKMGYLDLGYAASSSGDQSTIPTELGDLFELTRVSLYGNK